MNDEQLKKMQEFLRKDRLAHSTSTATKRIDNKKKKPPKHKKVEDDD
jgi:hypothetical protein